MNFLYQRVVAYLRVRTKAVSWAAMSFDMAAAAAAPTGVRYFWRAMASPRSRYGVYKMSAHPPLAAGPKAGNGPPSCRPATHSKLAECWCTPLSSGWSRRFQFRIQLSICSIKKRERFDHCREPCAEYDSGVTESEAEAAEEPPPRPADVRDDFGPGQTSLLRWTSENLARILRPRKLLLWNPGLFGAISLWCSNTGFKKI